MKENRSNPSQPPKPSLEEVLVSAEKKLATFDLNIQVLENEARQAIEDAETCIVSGIRELEALTKKGDRIQQIEKAVKEKLAGFMSFSDNQALQNNPRLEKQVEEVRKLLASLAEEAKAVREEISKIGQQTAVTSRIDEDDATEREELQLKQDATKTKEGLIRKTKEEFDKEANQFATEIEKYTAELNAWYTENDRLKEESQLAYKKVEAVIKNALGMLGGKSSFEKSQIKDFLDRLNSKAVLEDESKIDEVILKLAEKRRSLGHWWGGHKEEKAVIDFILANQNIFTFFQEAFAKANKREGGERFTKEKSRLVEEFKRIQQKYSSLDLHSAVSSLYKDGRGKGKYTDPGQELTHLYTEVRYQRR